MTLQQLSHYILEAARTKYPSVPAHAMPLKSYSDKTANGLATAILDFCGNTPGVFAVRNGSEGRYRPGEVVTDVIGRQRQMKGTWLPGHKTGSADVEITIGGRIYNVEIKIGEDRQRPDQVKYMNNVRAAGGVYEIVKSWEEFYNYYTLWTGTR